MNADMLCPWCKSPPCSDAIGTICSTTTDWECGSSIGCAHQRQSSACKRIERLRAIVEADDRRFAWLAGGGVDCGPVAEGFSVLLDDFWCFLGDAIRERIGEENDSPDIEGTDEDRIRAFRAMIDAAMAAEKARKG